MCILEQFLCYHLPMDWTSLFHEFVIPFLCGLVLTLGKAIADQKALSFDDSNDIALDLIFASIGAMVAFQIDKAVGSAPTKVIYATFDAGVGDAVLAASLLYWRNRRKRLGQMVNGVFVLPPVHPVAGGIQVILGAGSVIWTIKAF
jgi:hypothetical protein